MPLKVLGAGGGSLQPKPARSYDSTWANRAIQDEQRPILGSMIRPHRQTPGPAVRESFASPEQVQPSAADVDHFTRSLHGPRVRLQWGSCTTVLTPA